jgi:hypothetical protein
MREPSHRNEGGRPQAPAMFLPERIANYLAPRLPTNSG